MLRPQKLHHRMHIKAFNYGRPLNHLLTHVILVRVAPIYTNAYIRYVATWVQHDIASTQSYYV